LNRKYIIFFVFFCFFIQAGYAQKRNTPGQKIPDNNDINADTIVVIGQESEHSPRKATIYSAVFPGLGQIYNKKYWKLPLIYGGFVALIYSINMNNNYYQLYKTAYSDIIDSDPTTKSYEDLDIEGSWDFTNTSEVEQFTSRLSTAKESSLRYRNLCVIGTIALYAANILDASVDANFFNFDISEDITLNWIPQSTLCMNRTMIGFQCVLKF